MQAQINFSNTKPFVDFMSGLASLEEASSLIHGIYIYPHPIWRRLAERSLRHGAHDPYYYSWIECDYDEGDQLLDFSQKPPYWDNYCHNEGKETDPFLVRVFIEPVTNKTLSLRQQIRQYARQHPFFVSVEEETHGVLAASIDGGLDVNAPNSGTLGGFLKDQNGHIWGITCGHVAMTKGASFALPDVAGLNIPNAGKVHESNYTSHQLSPAGGVCNQYISPQHPNVDVALLRLDPRHSGSAAISKLGTIVDVYNRTILGSGSKVTMRGARSRKNTYVIGGYGVTGRFEGSNPGDFYCFSHLFDFAAPGATRGGRVRQAAAPRPLKGDSGSFVCHTLAAGDLALFGMLIAVEGAKGVACFADSITDWADAEHGLRLTHF